MTRQLDFAGLRNLAAGKHIADAACPLCGPKRKSAANQKRKVLRIWNDGDFCTYCCARCGASGWARDDASVAHRSAPKPPAPIKENDKSELARFLWGRALPLRGSLAETYLRSRNCFIDSPSLRFLPARGEYPPAMIARFGEHEVTGVHLTKLRADGGGKAGTDNDKITLGPSVGQPIVVQATPERGELLIAEGIEDTASLAIVTGWSAWAAGTANRIGRVVEQAGLFDRVFVAVDDDTNGAGLKALAAARAARPNVVALRVWHLLGRSAADANLALRERGPEALLAAIEWSDIQARYAGREVSFSGLQLVLARAERAMAAAA